MNADDFRRIALSFDGVEQGSHMGAVDFRVGGHIFATLAAVAQGVGNLMLTPDQQRTFVDEMPKVFVPVKGRWGEDGATHIRLADVTEDVLREALHAAWRVRLARNVKPSPRKARSTRQSTGTESATGAAARRRR